MDKNVEMVKKTYNGTKPQNDQKVQYGQIYPTAISKVSSTNSSLTIQSEN